MGLLNISGGRPCKVNINFTATSLISEGGFAEIYHAYNSFRNAHVAAKLYKDYSLNAHDRAKKECEKLKTLQELKTSYFPVLDGGVRTTRIANNNYPILFMELCQFDGKVSMALSDLEEYFHSQPSKLEAIFPTEQALGAFILDICSALIHMHDAKVLHLDIKPANILIKRSPGDPGARPFIIDFNAEGANSLAGTRRYLAPEVISGDRKQPAVADDLYATAMTLWELLYGRNSSLTSTQPSKRWASFDTPSVLREALKLALSGKESERPSTAKELYALCENVLKPKTVRRYGLSSDELVWGKEHCQLFLNDMTRILVAEGEFPVLKETRQRVIQLTSELLEDTTRPFDLSREIESMGPSVIPAAIEESHKLSPDSQQFDDLIAALARFSEEELKAPIDFFCDSGSYVVRKVCRKICAIKKSVVDKMVKGLISETSPFLAEERHEIADLCLRYSKDAADFMPLNEYMCREYVNNPSESQYFLLRREIAERMRELQFANRPGLLFDDATSMIWTQFDSYDRMDAQDKEAVNRSLLELEADAFSSLGLEALELIKTSWNERNSNRNVHRVLRTFLRKLALKHDKSKEWLFEQLKNTQTKRLFDVASYVAEKGSISPEQSKILGAAREKLGLKNEKQSSEDCLSEFFKEPNFVNGLKVKRVCGFKVFDLIQSKLTKKNAVHILDLLSFFKDWGRALTIGLLLENWELFADVDYQRAVRALSLTALSTELHAKVKERLQKDLINSKRKSIALDGLDQFLQRSKN